MPFSLSSIRSLDTARQVEPRRTPTAESAPTRPDGGRGQPAFVDLFSAQLAQRLGSDAGGNSASGSTANSAGNAASGSSPGTRAVGPALAALLQSLYERLRQQLQERGVDSQRAFTLELDEHGQVRVRGDHPDAGRIEDLFEDDETLAQQAQLAVKTAELGGQQLRYSGAGFTLIGTS